MRINDRDIGPGHPPYIVAELSGEHLGDRYRALDLIKAAKEAGADAAKLQCFDPLKLADARGGRHAFVTDPLWNGRTFGDLYQETYTPREWFEELFAYGENIGITVFASVFDEDGVDFLVRLGCPALKIAAREARDTALISKVAHTGLPFIISTNADADISAWQDAWAKQKEGFYGPYRGGAAVLHCPPGYPCPIASTQLKRISQLFIRFSVVGFSDHTIGHGAAVASVYAGATVIEKHITLSRETGGPDKAYSLEPKEFAELVRRVREAHSLKVAA